MLARQGRTDEAIAEFRKAIDADPKFTPAYNNLAEALAKQGKLEDAARLLPALARARSRARPCTTLSASSCASSAGPDEAAEQFSKAKALSSTP